MAVKRYYWLKLKEDFFDDDTMKYIEEQENGIKYSNFYLKLCLKSLKTQGKLMRLIGETLIPYDVNSLAKLTGVDIDTVRCAMALFEHIGLVKVMESGEIYLAQINEMIGSETDKAGMMRRLRAQQKIEDSNFVTQMLPYIDIDINKDINKEINKKNKKPTLEEIEQYISEKHLKVNGKDFYNYFTEGNWIDSKGNKVKNWKQKLLTWNKYSDKSVKNNINNYEQREDIDYSKFYANGS